MDFSEIQEQIKVINNQIANVVSKVEDTTQIDMIKERLIQLEKDVKKTKHDQVAANMMDALRRSGM